MIKGNEHGKSPENLHFSKYCIYVYFISTNGRNAAADNFGLESWKCIWHIRIWEWHIIPNFYVWANLIRGGGPFSNVINVCIIHISTKSLIYSRHLLKLGNLAFTFTVLVHILWPCMYQIRKHYKRQWYAFLQPWYAFWQKNNVVSRLILLTFS